MKKIFSIMLGCMISNSCTTVQIPDDGYQERYTVTYEIREPKDRTLTKKKLCPSFVLPDLLPIPKIPFIEHKCEINRKCVEDALLKHIEVLREVLTINNARLKEAKRVYELCEIK